VDLSPTATVELFYLAVLQVGTLTCQIIMASFILASSNCTILKLHFSAISQTLLAPVYGVKISRNSTSIGVVMSQ